MDKSIEQCIKPLIAKWVSVSNPADVLIGALENDDWIHDERQLCKPLIEAFNKKDVTIEEIRTVVSSNTTTKQDEIDRLEKLISEGQLDSVSKDSSYQYLNDGFLHKLFKNKKTEIKNTIYEKSKRKNWLNASAWYDSVKDKLDVETKTEIEELFFLVKEKNKDDQASIAGRIEQDLREGKYALAHNLFKKLPFQSDFKEKYKKLYAESKFKKIEYYLEELDQKKAQQEFDDSRFKLDQKKFDSLLEKFKKKMEQKVVILQASIVGRIEQGLREEKYALAHNLFKKLPFQSDFKEKYKKLYAESKFKQIEYYLEELDQKKAQQEFDDSRFKLDQKKFDSLLEKFKKKMEQKVEILNAIKNNDFKKAYNLNKTYKLTTTEQFSNDNLRKPLEIFLNKYTTKRLEVDSDQAIAISADSKSTLIAARAGSGKTRVLLQRVTMLKHSYDFTPKNMLLLVFNKAVQLDIRNRLVDLYGWSKEEARQSIHTFHSFARSLLPKQEKSKDVLSEETQKKVIQTLFEKRLEEDLEFEQFFRRFILSSKSFIESKLDESSFDSKAHYHDYLRNQKYLTLDKQTVKSKGEKYIADFLFEHGIRYDYETIVSVLDGSRIYRPDFQLWNTNLNGKKIYIEHWGINENKPQTPAHWSTSAEDYIKEMELKRIFWKKRKNSILVESSIVDMAKGRDIFESILKQKLMNVGISPKKLSNEEILENLRAIWRRPLIDKFYTFIQKMQSSSHSKLELSNKIQSVRWSEALSATQKLFYCMALNIFDDYKDYKIEKKKLDYSDMLDQASDIIMNKSISGETEPRIEELKSVLIDEFQDFTHQFSAIINAIRNQNNELDIFCVGDDWQAINSFMGADLDHFINFSQANENPISHNLPKNYRSKSEIVNTGNEIMQTRGLPGQHIKTGGNVNQVYIDDNSWFDLKGKDKRYDVFRSKPGDENPMRRFDPGFIRARYLKEIYKILKIQSISNKDILVLTRNNSFEGLEKEELQSQLFRLLKEDVNNKDSYWESKNRIEQSIKFSTVHSVKGGEAETVIILGANDGYFPLLHPDNELFRIFDNHPNDYIKKSLEEERRLFYVAVTRAKEQLFFICEKNIASPFLRRETLDFTHDFLIDSDFF